MKKKFTSSVFAALLMLFVCNSVSAGDYSVSSGSAINITTPGSHSITGSGSSPVYITNTASNAVYNITLNNMTLNAGSWASAINLTNNATSGTMTVNFIIVGTNSSTGYNHGGIQATGGVVNVVFTTTGSGTLTTNAVYSDSFGFRNNGGTMNPSVDPAATCTATLAGTSKDVATALTGAFTQKPLVLSLSKTTTFTNEIKKLDVKVYSTSNGVVIEGLQKGEMFQIFDIIGKCVVKSEAKNAIESATLSKGVYILRTEKGQIKFAN
jgi:hypothetical protein